MCNHWLQQNIHKHTMKTRVCRIFIYVYAGMNTYEYTWFWCGRGQIRFCTMHISWRRCFMDNSLQIPQRHCHMHIHLLRNQSACGCGFTVWLRKAYKYERLHNVSVILVRRNTRTDTSSSGPVDCPPSQCCTMRIVQHHLVYNRPRFGRRHYCTCRHSLQNK